MVALNNERTKSRRLNPGSILGNKINKVIVGAQEHTFFAIAVIVSFFSPNISAPVISNNIKNDT